MFLLYSKSVDAVEKQQQQRMDICADVPWQLIPAEAEEVSVEKTSQPRGMMGPQFSSRSMDAFGFSKP